MGRDAIDVFHGSSSVRRQPLFRRGLRGLYARNLLAQGINPCEMKATLGKNAFARRMRDWEIVQNQRQECSPGRTMAGI